MFSIITIARNNLKGLQRTKASLPPGGFEWIIVDGASTDGTPTYLPGTGAKWLSEPDLGIYDAMNKGIARASGDYILFLNAGDTLYEPNTLQQITNFMNTRKPDFIYGDSLENSAYKKARRHKKAAFGMFTHHQAMFYRRQAIGEMRYDLSYRIAADYDFTLRFLKSAKDILYCPFAVCIFESGGISQQDARKGRREQFIIRKKTGTPSALNAAIYFMQSVSWGVRQAFPKIYWLLKAGGKPAGSNVPAPSRKPARPAHP